MDLNEITICQEEVTWTSEEIAAASSNSISAALMDTGCTADLCGSRWLTRYQRKLKEKGIHEPVEHRRTCVDYTFGCGRRRSTWAARLPVFPAGIKGFLWTNVIDDEDGLEVPMLLSKRTMRDTMDCILYMREDTAQIFG